MKSTQNNMEQSLLEILTDISNVYGIGYDDLLEKYSSTIKHISEEYEDAEVHTRCKGKNKNNKRCSKTRKENSEYCSIHSEQYKDKEKDTDFLSSDVIDKKALAAGPATSSLQIIETTKKKGVLPEKIKKLMYDSKKYYINKNDWVYEMDQTTEIIISDIPIGKLFSGKLMVLKLDEVI
jgi:hypothetical protein